MAAAIRLSQQHSCSLDYLVGAREHRDRYLEAERPSGLEIDDQLEFGGELDRQIAGLLALEDAIDIFRRAAVEIDIVDAVRGKAAVHDVVAVREDIRQAVTHRQ